MLGICSIQVKQKSEIIFGSFFGRSSRAENAGSLTDRQTRTAPSNHASTTAPALRSTKLQNDLMKDNGARYTFSMEQLRGTAWNGLALVSAPLFAVTLAIQTLRKAVMFRRRGAFWLRCGLTVLGTQRRLPPRHNGGDGFAHYPGCCGDIAGDASGRRVRAESTADRL